jgi:hypothetical protein
MVEIMKATVLEILNEDNDKSELMIEIEHEIKKALNYNRITGKVRPGDRILVNTTAGTLKLGTGGIHFVMANLCNTRKDYEPGGHGIKLRYTPVQLKVSYSEEDGSEYKKIYNMPLDLKGKNVFFGELHSMLPPLCAALKSLGGKSIKVTYIMTDHGALPASFSRNIDELRKKGLLDYTITIGNSFGGDFECMNIYTALQTASARIKSDAIIISMGPGIAGTGTKYGFSGLELAFYIDFVLSYTESCHYIPRIGFHDARERHKGISHHTLTILSELLAKPVSVTLPWMDRTSMRAVIEQIMNFRINKAHKLSIMDGSYIRESMKESDLFTKTMGRGISEEPYFYFAIGAAVKRAFSD